MGKPNLDELIELSRAVFNELEQAIGEKNGPLGRELIEKLQKIVSAAAEMEEIPYDAPEIVYPGRSFCLSGLFLHGSKEKCAQKIKDRGGIVANSVTEKLDYIVIGKIPNPEWAHGNYGRKVERALELRERKGRPLIIKESHWLASLGAPE